LEWGEAKRWKTRKYIEVASFQRKPEAAYHFKQEDHETTTKTKAR
jgi:hypothetical protein